MADILAGHAEAARQADTIIQSRIEKACILLQALLHTPPDEGGIPEENRLPRRHASPSILILGTTSSTVVNLTPWPLPGSPDIFMAQEEP